MSRMLSVPHPFHNFTFCRNNQFGSEVTNVTRLLCNGNRTKKSDLFIALFDREDRCLNKYVHREKEL